MRICHYIKPNARSEQPSRAIWFQAWTYELSKEHGITTYGLEFIRMCRGTKDTNTGNWSYIWKSVNSSDHFWETIDQWTSAKTKTYLICDQPNIHLPLIRAFYMTVQNKWKLTLAVLPPAPTICRWRKNSKSIVLLGTSNIWPTPFVECSTGKTECLHLNKGDEYAPCEHVKLIDQKIEAIRTMTVEWWQFLKVNDLGGFSPTIGAQSVRVWRHKFMTHQVLIDCHDDALALARESIYGARCEILNRAVPRGKIYELDTNGSYGGIMRDMRVPVKLQSYRRHFTIRDLCEWLQDSVCIARVTVDYAERVFPLHRENRLTFASGRFNTVLAGEELKYACDGGYVLDASEVAIYEAIPAFNDYMSALWNMRQLSESIGSKRDAARYKLLMASFFGRWAQHGRIWEQCGKVNNDEIQSWIDYNVDTKETTEYRQFGGIIQRLSQEPESAESSPAIAACILAGARMQLWRRIKRAKEENIYYVDTDSLFCNEMAVERLRGEIQPNVLGMLKIKAIYDSASFLGKKFVWLDGKLRASGISLPRDKSDTGRFVQTQNRHVGSEIQAGRVPTASTKTVSRKYKVSHD